MDGASPLVLPEFGFLENFRLLPLFTRLLLEEAKEMVCSSVRVKHIDVNSSNGQVLVLQTELVKVSIAKAFCHNELLVIVFRI